MSSGFELFHGVRLWLLSLIRQSPLADSFWLEELRRLLTDHHEILMAAATQVFGSVPFLPYTTPEIGKSSNGGPFTLQFRSLEALRMEYAISGNSGKWYLSDSVIQMRGIFQPIKNLCIPLLLRDTPLFPDSDVVFKDKRGHYWFWGLRSTGDLVIIEVTTIFVNKGSGVLYEDVQTVEVHACKTLLQIHELGVSYEDMFRVLMWRLEEFSKLRRKMFEDSEKPLKEFELEREMLKLVVEVRLEDRAEIDPVL